MNEDASEPGLGTQVGVGSYRGHDARGQLFEHGSTGLAIHSEGDITNHVETHSKDRETSEVSGRSRGTRGISKNSSSDCLTTRSRVQTDSDWAGYRSIRNSTTRRVVSTNVGDIKHRISTQSLVHLSPYAEELYAMNKEVLEATGIKSLAADMGISFSNLLKTDAVAALGVVNRRGIGKMSHIRSAEDEHIHKERAGRSAEKAHGGERIQEERRSAARKLALQ